MPKSKVKPTSLFYGEPKYVPGKGLFIGNESNVPEQISGSGEGGASYIKEKIAITVKTKIIQSFYPSTPEFIMIFINGILQDDLDEYNISGQTITFVEDLQVNDKIILIYDPIINLETLTLDALTFTGTLEAGDSRIIEADRYPGSVYSWYVNEVLIQSGISNKYTLKASNTVQKNIRYVMELKNTEFLSNTINVIPILPDTYFQALTDGVWSSLGTLFPTQYDILEYRTIHGITQSNNTSYFGCIIDEQIEQNDEVGFKIEIIGATPNKQFYISLVPTNFDMKTQVFSNLISGNLTTDTNGNGSIETSVDYVYSTSTICDYLICGFNVADSLDLTKKYSIKITKTFHRKQI